MTWTKLVDSFSVLFNSYVKKYAVSFVLKTIGITGGIWTKVVSFLLTKVFIYAKKQADQAALIADQAKKDKEILEKYKEAIKNNASEQELIDLEQDLLNGGRK
jgi:hypothetical protein